MHQQSVKQLIDQRAADCPEKLFLQAAENGASLSFADLQQNCQRVAAFLDAHHIAVGETVAFLLDNGYWTTCLFLGVMYSGRVVLPLNAVAGVEQLGYVIEHSELRLIFCSDTYRKQYAAVLERSGHHYQVITSHTDLPPAGLSLDNPPAAAADNAIDAEQTALLIYTSGTTGKPKGVMLSHRNVLAGGRNTVDAHRLTATDIGLCVLPLYHINAEMVSVMATLVCGGCVVMSRTLSITQFWHWLQDYGCTWFSVVPTIIAYLIEQRQREQAAGQADIDFAALAKRVRFGRSASAALSPATHKQFETLFGLPIIETMGISECAAQILSTPLRTSAHGAAGEQAQPDAPCYGSPGRPVGNEMRVVDAQHNVLADNIQGELAVRGDNVMQGYLKNPAATQAALDPDGWFYTGDLGYRDQHGYYFVTGRLKELIIRGGENIAPREIDDVLYKHPSVLEAAAFGIPHPHYGQEVSACVSLKPQASCTEAELRQHCQQLLGEVKSPKRVHIIDALPKGPSGKIQRLKLAEQDFA